MYRFVLLLLFILTFSCGSEEGAQEDAQEGPAIVLASGSVLATPDIQAESKEHVIIFNYDDTPHSITSQSANDAFDNTGTFDVLVPSNGKAILTLPNAAAGTVYFYYCRFHQNGDTPANGQITVQ